MNRETTDRVLAGLLMAALLVVAGLLGSTVGGEVGDAAGLTRQPVDADDLADDLRRLREGPR